MRAITRSVVVVVVSALLIAVLAWLTRMVEIPLRTTSPVDADAGRSLVVRTDFSDEGAWRSMVSAIEAPAGDFRGILRFVSDPANDGMTPDRIVAFARQADRTFIFVVDRVALTNPDRPILVIDAYDQPGRSFRVVPASMWLLENNLALANMDFEEYATAVDGAGIFRGFRRR